MPSGSITEHFTWAEARCRCGCSLPLSLRPNIERAAAMAEKVRVLLGNEPMLVGSWYRCPAYNKKVGGVPWSQHLEGLAIDFTVKNLTPARVQKIVEDAAFPTIVRGLGRYPGFTHIDARVGQPEVW